MASGKLGALSSTSIGGGIIYTVPANKISTVNIAVTGLNGGGTGFFRLIIGGIDYYNVPVAGNLAFIEFTAIVLSAGEQVEVATSGSTQINVRVHGFEEAI